MSSVPAHEVERPPIPGVATAEIPLRADTSLRLVVTTPELYPTLFQVIRAAVCNGRWFRKSRRQAELAEVGRGTGVRV